MKLSIKLAIFISLLAVVCSALVGLLSFNGVQQGVRESIGVSLNAKILTVEKLASLASFQRDELLAQEIVDGLSRSSEVACAKIESESFSAQSPGECDRHSISKNLYSPVDSKQRIGFLTIYKNQDYIQNLSIDSAFRQLSWFLLLIGLLSLSMFLVVYLKITKPIETISKQLSSINFDSDVLLIQEGLRTDEIGIIGRTINMMLVNAKKQIVSEKILTKRTEELSKNFKLVFELSKNYLAVTDKHLNLKSYNPRFSELILKSSGEDVVLGSDCWLDHVSENPEKTRNFILSNNEFNEPFTTEIECSYAERDEQIHGFFNLTFVKSAGENGEATILIFINDITEHRRVLLETEYQATHDNLTGLYNRLAATRKIRYLLSSQADDENVAIIFVDLDGFKQINDEFGHDAGDKVLKIVAKRLKSSIRKSDLACRWGGDEFLIALDNVTLNQASSLATNILTRIVEPISFNESSELTKSVGASIGLAISTHEIHDFSTLFDLADKAMYKVKKSGKNAVLVHS